MEGLHCNTKMHVVCRLFIVLYFFYLPLLHTILDITSVEFLDGRRIIHHSKNFSINKLQEDLFNFTAKCVAEFTKEKAITKKLPVGFAFSFPVKQENLTSGKLLRWTKGYKATGAEHKDVVQLLKAAFDKWVSIFNPRRTCLRVTVVVLCVCVSPH